MRCHIYTVKFTNTAKKQFNSFGSKIQSELANVLEELAKDPLIGKPLQGPLKGFRSKRIGKFRIIYKQMQSELVIMIVNIEHRKDVYKRRK